LRYLIVLLLLIGCTQHHEIQPELITVSSVADDFKIPKAFVLKIKESLSKESQAKPEFIFSPLKVSLYSDQENVLQQNYLHIQLPNGGGKIDLAEWLKGDGSFYLGFPSEQFNNPQVTLENIYYISDVPQVTVDGEKYGLGCGKWIDLKPKLKEVQKHNFLKLNTFNLRYLYVSVGYYLVVQKKGTQYFVSHLNLTDSRYKDKLCSGIFALNK